MKKFLTLFILASSIIVIGCNNQQARNDMEKILKYVGNISFHGPSCVPETGLGSCDYLGNYSIVEESAEGEDRVVLKKWVEGTTMGDICRADLVSTDIEGIDANSQTVTERELTKNFCSCVLQNYDVDDIGPDSQDIKINKPVSCMTCLIGINLDDLGPDSQEIGIAKLITETRKNICDISMTEGHWQYIPVDLSHFDFDKWVADGKSEETIHELLNYSLERYGELFYEAGDDEYFYNYDGKRVLFSEATASVKDLELMGAKVEDNNAITLGEKLAAQYGLSEERGLEVAKTLSVYNKLTSKRSLTPNEMDSFSNKILGVDYKAAEQGLKSGDAEEFNALMEKAAETNGTSPEAMSAIIRDMVL